MTAVFIRRSKDLVIRVVAVAVLATIYTFLRFGHVQAAPLTDVSWETTSTLPDQTATYTFRYTVATDVGAAPAGRVARITFDGYNTMNLDTPDINVTADGVTYGLHSVVTYDFNTVEIMVESPVQAGSEVVVTIGNIHNPSDPDDYSLHIATGDVNHQAVDAYPTQTVTIAYPPVAFDSGDGSLNNPYNLHTCEQLQNIWNDLGGYYLQTADITCTGLKDINGGRGFNPIGSQASPFTGGYTGQGYKIFGMYIYRADESPNYDFGVFDERDVGIFGVTDGANISGINVVNARVQGWEHVGGIIGNMKGGFLGLSSFNATTTDNSCILNEAVNGGYCVWARYGYQGGGLVGLAEENATIEESLTGGPVKGSGQVIGGLVGELIDSTLQHSSTSSNTDGGYRIGGAVGSASNSTIDWVAASGSVYNNTVENYKDGLEAGGLIGYVEYSVVSHSQATGDVTAENSNGGGLIGHMTSGSVSDAYATGDVHVFGYSAGGLIGYLEGGDVTRTYATGVLTMDTNDAQWAGGLIGSLMEYGEPILVSDSFAIGEVAAPNYTGGVVGYYDESYEEDSPANAELRNVYYDQEGTGLDHCYTQGDGTPAAGDACQGVANGTQYFIDWHNEPFGDGIVTEWINWNFNGTDLPTLCEADCQQVDPAPTEDTDGDGVADSVENGNMGGDANGDGIPDYTQANVLPISVQGGQSFVTVVIPEDLNCVLIQGDLAWLQPTIIKNDPGYSHQTAEMVLFNVGCPDTGTVPVTLFYDRLFDTSKSVVRFFNDVTQTYSTISGAILGSHTVNGQSVTTAAYTLTDGGPYDTDGVVDSVIHDPVGLAIPDSTATTNPLGETGQNFLYTLPLAFMFILTTFSILHLRKTAAKNHPK